MAGSRYHQPVDVNDTELRDFHPHSPGNTHYSYASGVLPFPPFEDGRNDAKHAHSSTVPLYPTDSQVYGEGPQAKLGNPWRPGVWRRLPINGILALLGALACTNVPPRRDL